MQPGGGFRNLGGSGWTALQPDAGHKKTEPSQHPMHHSVHSQGAATHRTGMWMILDVFGCFWMIRTIEILMNNHYYPIINHY